jgi:transmembrane sensor
VTAEPHGLNGREEALLDVAAQWLTRARAGMGPRDRAAFLAWLRECPEHAAAADMVARAWEAAPAAARHGGFAPQLAPVERRVGRPARRFRIGRWAGGALAVASVAAFAFLVATPQVQDFATGPGERRVALLEDGTRVWLEPDTRLSASIGRLGRHVTLEHGEAAFDVVHQARGFTVAAGDVTVEDLGTLFDVAHRTDAPTMATLAHGSVTLRDPTSGETLATPRPGEQVEIFAGLVTTRTVDAAGAMAWREGRLIFSNTPLADALDALHHNGAAGVRLQDQRLGKLRISGAYSVADLDSFLDAVAALHPVRWQHTSQGYAIVRR